MDLARSLGGPLRRHPLLADLLADVATPVLLAVAFLVVPVALPTAPGRPDGRPPLDVVLTGPDVALTLLAALALTVRRRRPLVALVVTGALTAAALVGDWRVNLAQLAVAIALFSYGLRRPRGRTITATAITAGTLGAVSVLVVVLGAADWGRQDVVLWLCTAAAVAVAMQSRRAAFAALEDRARRAEETREETARRRVAEDRVRIARELHDVIAHHVAVISVQAGVAAHVVEQNPAAARDALGTVRSSAKTVLAELQSVLGVLRQDESALPTTPAPGLSRLADLVDSFASTGTPARLDAPDPVPQLPPAADVAAYRLVQEALTNVHKHAAGAAATVHVRSRTDTVELVVTNGPPPKQPPPANRGVPDGAGSTGSGLGLVGMRERVLAAGGALETGPTADGGFRVAARMPLHGGTR
jgi:signal transduction histidine kinase